MPSTFLIQISKERGYKNLTENHKIKISSGKGKNRRRARGDVEQSDTVLFYCTGDVPEHAKSLACCAPVQSVSVSPDKTVIRFGNIEWFRSSISLDRIRELVDKKELEGAFRKCGVQGFSVTRLQPASLPRLRQLMEAEERPTAHGKSAGTREHTTPLAEDAYFRETGPRLERIVRRHNELSNRFAEWLKLNGYSDVRQETGWVDAEFTHSGELCRAELKICYAVGTTKSIREALGQLLEYNYYGIRELADRWLVVLDQVPTAEDKEFVDRLRTRLGLPVYLGWEENRGFTLLHW